MLAEQNQTPVHANIHQPELAVRPDAIRERLDLVMPMDHNGDVMRGGRQSEAAQAMSLHHDRRLISPGTAQESKGVSLGTAFLGKVHQAVGDAHHRRSDP